MTGSLHIKTDDKAKQKRLLTVSTVFWISAVILLCVLILCAFRYQIISRLLQETELLICVCLVLAFVGCIIGAMHTMFRVEQQQKTEDLYKSKLAMISSQVQPHFLYNAISAIRMIDGNPQETIDALGDFAKFLRGSFSSLDMENPIPFEKELELTKEYIRLEKLRFQDRLQVNFDLKDMDFVLPAMAMEVLVENAVKHGIAGRIRGGTVTVSTAYDGKEHIVTVQDDGVGFNVSSLNMRDGTMHYGLRSVRNRLEYQVGGRLMITSRQDPEHGGTTAVIRIPEDFF